MYKFAAVSMASLGIFLTGLLSGATLIAYNDKYGTETKTEEKKPDDLDKAWADVQSTLK